MSTRLELIADTLSYIKTLDEKTLIVSPESLSFFSPKVALLSFSDEETSFLEKLSLAINQHLFPAQVINAANFDESVFVLVITSKSDFTASIPVMHISDASHYATNPEAKRTLWKSLCQRLAPASS